MKVFLLFVGLILLNGCNSYEIPQAGTQHPANPQAETSSDDIKQTDILHVDESNLPESPREMQKDKMNSMEMQ